MEDLLAARLQMAISLAFHIIFAVIGMTMPFLMVAAQSMYLRTGQQVYRDLTRAWARGVAILFATGAVSGTVLSFELGLLWPKFMQWAGPLIGMPFSWEGAAFFLEAIFLGLFLYGEERLPKSMYLFSGVMVGLSGVASGVFVVCANAWMNSPAGFEMTGGVIYNIDPFAAMFNPAWLSQTSHMVVAAFEATGFGVAGVHAFLLLKRPGNIFHKKAVQIAFVMGAAAAILQPVVGHYAAQDVAARQPIKLAAMESHFETTTWAPAFIGGWPDMENETVDYAIEIPGLLSFLAFDSFEAEVRGLKDFPKEEWPNVPIVHLAFQVMVGLGTWLMGLGLLGLFLMKYRSELFFHRRFLQLLAMSSVMGFIAIEAGWVVTEVGRQPWIIYGVMKTKDALTDLPGIQYHFYLFTGIYLLLGGLVIWLMTRQIRALPPEYGGEGQ